MHCHEMSSIERGSIRHYTEMSNASVHRYMYNDSFNWLWRIACNREHRSSFTFALHDTAPLTAGARILFLISFFIRAEVDNVYLCIKDNARVEKYWLLIHYFPRGKNGFAAVLKNLAGHRYTNNPIEIIKSDVRVWRERCSCKAFDVLTTNLSVSVITLMVRQKKLFICISVEFLNTSVKLCSTFRVDWAILVISS